MSDIERTMVVACHTAFVLDREDLSRASDGTSSDRTSRDVSDAVC